MQMIEKSFWHIIYKIDFPKLTYLIYSIIKMISMIPSNCDSENEMLQTPREWASDKLSQSDDN